MHVAACPRPQRCIQRAAGACCPPWVWHATAWNDTSTYTVEELDDTVLGEDPFLYIDPYDESILHGPLSEFDYLARQPPRL